MTQIAELTDRAVLRIDGADARDFLQGLLTNDAATLPAWAGLLSAQGKYLFDMILHDGGDGAILLDVFAERAADLAKRLTMYKLRRAVTVTPATLKVFAAWDGESDKAYDPRLPSLGRRWVSDSADTSATLADYDVHRLALGVPGSADFEVDKTMWLETNAVELAGVSFTKGCYVGQENTARMHHRDRLRKRLLPVRFDGDAGDGVIRADDREAGTLRTHRNGGGMALLRLEYVERGDALTLGGAPVTVEWPSWIPARTTSR